jgi:hypothetical protein
LGYEYIFTWKCHKETPCVAILNKQIYHFFSSTKLENKRVEQVLSRGWYQWEGGESGKRVRESEYGANTVYTCM